MTGLPFSCSHKWKRLVVWIFMAGIPALALGQPHPLPDRLSLDQAAQLFIQNNPALKQARAKANRQLELAASSALWPNPSVELEQERTDAEKQQTALIDQPILNPVEFSSRKRSARAQKESAVATYREQASSLYFELRKKYVTAVTSGERLEVLQQLTQTVRRAIKIIRVRYEEGDAGSYQLKRLNTALADYENRLAQQEVKQVEAYTDLLSFIAPEGDMKLAGGPSTTVELTDTLRYRPKKYAVDQLLQEALQQRGLITSARSSNLASRQQLRAEKAARFPDLSLRGGIVREPSLDTPTAPFLGIGIGIPLWNNNGHQIKASQAALKQSQARLDMAQRQVRKEVRTAYSQFKSYKERIENINQSLLEESKGLLDDALYLYSEGEISLVELLDAVSSSLDSRMLRLELLTRYRISRYRLEWLTGRVPNALISSGEQ